MADTIKLATPPTAGGGDDQPSPPSVVSPWESMTIRWIAAQIPGGLNYLLNITHLATKFHITAITENGVLQVIYFILGCIGAYKIFAQRIRTGRDPKNANVPVVKLPNVVNSLIKQ